MTKTAKYFTNISDLSPTYSLSNVDVGNFSGWIMLDVFGFIRKQLKTVFYMIEYDMNFLSHFLHVKINSAVIEYFETALIYLAKLNYCRIFSRPSVTIQTFSSESISSQNLHVSRVYFRMQKMWKRVHIIFYHIKMKSKTSKIPGNSSAEVGYNVAATSTLKMEYVGDKSEMLVKDLLVWVTNINLEPSSSEGDFRKLHSLLINHETKVTSTGGLKASKRKWSAWKVWQTIRLMSVDTE